MKAATVETERLILRPIQSCDAVEIQAIASDFAIADTMISIPHPYPEGEAARLVESKQAAMKEGQGIAFSILEKEGARSLVGVAEVRDLEVDEHSCQAEVSFWIAKAKWGKGYMSEAVPVLLDFGFDTLKINRLYAYHMVRNPACGRVLEKNGFTKEGILRQRVEKWGKYEDVALWAIVASDRKQNGKIS
jgi:[ribosomal protein S5]-alanine N-acetyltransferase